MLTLRYCVTGPPSEYYVRTVVGLIFLAVQGAFCVMPGLYLYHTERTGWVSGSIAFGGMALICYLWTGCKNPGVIPRPVYQPNAPSTSLADLNNQEQGSKGLLSLHTERWCPTCKLMKPPMSSHCSTCDHCVRGFDHHCGWMGGCIGEGNHRQFVWTLMFVCLGCMYNITLKVWSTVEVFKVIGLEEYRDQ